MGRVRTVEDQAILEAARNAFLERGQFATTREIADVSGISQAVLYQRFGSKDDLFFAAMTPPPPDIEHLLGNPPKSAAAAKRYLTGLSARLYSYFETVAPLMIQLAMHKSFTPQKIVGAHTPVKEINLEQSISDRLRLLNNEGLIKVADVDAMTQMLVSLSHRDALAAALFKIPVRLERQKEMINLIWNGVKP